MAYNVNEKINMIDNKTNRMAIATAIVEDIFKTYNLKGNDLLETWLIDNIIADSLFDIIHNEQKFYIISLAEKCMADIVCIKGDEIDEDNFISITRGFGGIGKFIEMVVEEFGMDSVTLFNVACDTASVFGYDDTLVIDDTMYVYDNGAEERILVYADLTISHHRNYTSRNIKHRVAKRLHHRWHTDIKLINVTENENGTFSVKVVFFAPQSDADNINGMLLNRFGATSGKPWYRCHVGGFGIHTAK